MVATVTASFAQRVGTFPPRNHHHPLTTPSCGCKSSDQLPLRCNLVFYAPFFSSSLGCFLSKKTRCQLCNVHFSWHNLKIINISLPSRRLADLLKMRNFLRDFCLHLVCLQCHLNIASGPLNGSVASVHERRTLVMEKYYDNFNFVANFGVENLIAFSSPSFCKSLLALESTLGNQGSHEEANLQPAESLQTFDQN